MTVVVTGASGLLGSALMTALRGSIDVIGFSRRRGEGLETVASYVDLQAPSGAVLVHLAETRDVAGAHAAGHRHVVTTVENCRRLLDKPWSHVVYASSAVVYGDAFSSPRRPNEPVTAQGAYSEAKLACEALVREAGGTILRLANLYGPGMSSNSVIAEIIAQLASDGPVVVRDTTPVRDFLQVADAAAGVAAAVSKRPGGCLNLGSGEGISIGSLAGLVLELAGQNERDVRAVSPSTRRSHLVLDISDTIDRLAWHPATALASGLKMLLRTKS